MLITVPGSSSLKQAGFPPVEVPQAIWRASEVCQHLQGCVGEPANEKSIGQSLLGHSLGETVTFPCAVTQYRVCLE